jgi:hypothetical protein
MSSNNNTEIMFKNESNTNIKPSRASEPIIQTSIINFHKRTIAVPDCLIPHHNLDEQFGIFKLKIRSEIPIRKDLHVHLNVDKSGSMSERCRDGSSKMHHIQHTLENMLRIFHQKTESNISVHIKSFDSNIYTALETVEDIKSKTAQELEQIISQIYAISPSGSTNIEKTLISAASNLKEEKEDRKKRLTHILLTDGQITDGKSNKTYLKSLINNDYPNIFLGYGLQHDNILLESLASTGKHNEYRFIDNLEKAGLVYGEVIHQLLYTAIEDVTLKAENCEIYDYATNTWTDTLYIGHLISEQEKTLQIRTTNTKSSQIAIYGRTIHQTKPAEVLTDDIVLQSHVVPVIMETIPCDLTNYMFRQKTQELLFATKQMHRNIQYEKDIQDNKYVIDDFEKYKHLYETGERESILSELESQKRELKTKLKTKIQSFFKTMLDYVEANQMKENEFYKMLCDDMYIAIKSFEIANGHMFASARHTSQGRQQSYTPRFTDEELQQQQQPDFQPTTLKRCNTLLPRQTPRYVSLQNTNQNQNLLTSMDDLNPVTRGYTLSQTDTSPYTSIGQEKMMREVSLNQNTNLSQTTSPLDAP